MDQIELLYMAGELALVYRDILKVDPVVKMVFRALPGDYDSRSEKDPVNHLSWIVYLNPSKHDSVEDIQYSVIDGLLSVLMEEFDLLESTVHLKEIKGRLKVKLNLAFSNLLPTEFDDESTD